MYGINNKSCKKNNIWRFLRSGAALLLAALMVSLSVFGLVVSAADADDVPSETGFEVTGDDLVKSGIGGGFAVTGQISEAGYTSVLYNATNGLPTSDANVVFCDSKGYIWIGGYSGIIRYDGQVFERMDATGGLTSGRAIFEDSRQRIWVGTNDNGVVLLDGGESVHYTDADGLASSSVRTFAEDLDGNVYIGTTNGISYVDSKQMLKKFSDERITSETIVRLSADRAGTIYGCTKSGAIFSIKSGKIDSFYRNEETDFEKVSTILADQSDTGKVYFGTEDSCIYYGEFGNSCENMTRISTEPTGIVYWLESACNRIWICSEKIIGYIDTRNIFRKVENVPMNDSIDMMTADYQGNLWFASSRQGVMKIVTNNFENFSGLAGLQEEVVNAACIYHDKIYVGTDDGLRVISKSKSRIKNKLTVDLEGNRIRCINTDNEDGLWISVYTNDVGLVNLASDGSVKYFTKEEGMPSNEVRCTANATDGSVIVGTNEGLAVIKDGKVVRTVTGENGIDNTVLLTVCQGDGDAIYAGSDGDGIYVIKPSGVEKLSRKDGLTSDVILRIKKDETNGIYWIITSNSIEYMKDGEIKTVTTFPYNNNFDIYFDNNGNSWVLSSYGLYCVKTEDMINDNISDFRLYTIANGLISTPTSNAYSALDTDGSLYIAGRSGLCKVNIDHYFEETFDVRVGIKSIFVDDLEILPGEDGVYTIPASRGRISITPAILDYTMTNPQVHMFFDGADNEGITALRSNISTLEYTDLRYGNYRLHIQVLDQATGDTLLDEAFHINKKPRFLELFVVRVLLVIMLALATGFIVWRTMTGTVIRRQYDEIQKAKDEAERANSAKSRFLANMSHEIRTPINTIMGMDEMIMREDTENVPKTYSMSVINYAIDIMNASESLLGLINDLLDISKIESGKMNLVEQEYDTASLLRSVVSMIRIRSEQKDLFFTVSIDETLPIRLYGDAGKIKQIVLNLLTNAVKYTEEGGFTLSVKVTKKEGETADIRFSVKDTGIGVKEEDMEKLFTAYERLDEEKNSGIQGTGLGLDISRRFAELMSGNLWCESTYGEGSEFILELPQKVIIDQGIGAFDESDDSQNNGPYVPQFVAPDAEVLVVDDNPMNLTVIKGLLKATRVFVTTASSGEECLEKLKYGKYDVVLLDHMMPGMDGIETVERIRETDKDLPVYALTANAMAGGDEFYISKGFNGYLAKPIDSISLERAIMRHLPEEIMMNPSVEDAINELNELPDEYLWIRDVDGINADEGIKASGGITTYIQSVKDYYETIEHASSVIENAWNDGDIRLYTVKVHALKTSARIIGALELSEKARLLEEAGNKEDIAYIESHKDELLSDFRSYLQKLSRLDAPGDNDDRPMISKEDLEDAYGAMTELVPAMDYDSMEMILDQIDEYKLPEEDEARFKAIRSNLKSLEWDAIEKILGEM